MDALFDLAMRLVEMLGVPIAALASVTVVVLNVLAARAVFREKRRDRIAPALAAFALAAAGHGADVFMTFRVSPDLQMEANPLWLAVVNTLGFRFAFGWAVIGGSLACVLCGFAMAWSLAAQERYRAVAPASFWASVQGYGAGKRIGPIASLFAWVYALHGGFFFYVAFMNSMAKDPDAQAHYPSPLTMSLFWMTVTTLGFLWKTYQKQPEQGRTLNI